MKKHSVSLKSFIIVCCLAFVFLSCFIVLFVYGGYLQKIVSKISPSKQIVFHPKYSDNELDAWSNCLEQLHVDSDIVFLGDSITERGKFDTYFSGKTVCNLGIGSDTIVGMTERIDMIELVSPEKIFIMGGINSLRNNTLNRSIEEYDELLKTISKKSFKEVFVISVLPLSMEKSNSIGCSQNTIASFNSSINNLANKYSFTFIDLHTKLVSSDGFIKQEYTTDGAHLTDDAYQIWVDEISPFISSLH